jgi:hypothetical protein
MVAEVQGFVGIHVDREARITVFGSGGRAFGAGSSLVAVAAVTQDDAAFCHGLEYVAHR